MFEIVERSEMPQGPIVSNGINVPRGAAQAEPGQFVIWGGQARGERLPPTMADPGPARS